MRTIKFRAWDNLENRIWWNVQDAYDGLEYHDRPDKRDQWKEGHPENQYLIGITCFGDLLEDPERFEIMQFTGLLDKNGKEIYEGDVVQGDRHWEAAYNQEFHYKKGIVEYLEWDACFSAMHDERLGVFCNSISGPSLTCKDIEVIGNIWQNPELLEGKE